ncbi:hypothetical protein [Oceanibaculum pacificum]|uniref:Uncharacterized protein n=1 Tax=Oceanibaculum pacificum TaxID=580166 RepID=A0A154W350_9PROT|nr:hypothetical protein [Oceanibaculum pacificum]KZD07960.1 hypothetical protein AUP43_09210 [Oceanibaculum pacificum]
MRRLLLTLLSILLSTWPAMAAEQEDAGGRAADRGPLDLRLVIHEHFSVRMPFGWWTGPPERSGKIVYMDVNIPVWWRGNPTAEMLNLCPPRHSVIWDEINLMRLRPISRGLPWSEHECRR